MDKIETMSNCHHFRIRPSALKYVALGHLGNIANRQGRSLRFDPDQEEFVDDLEADKLLARAYQDGHWARPMQFRA